jgi:hypothetical protein
MFFRKRRGRIASLLCKPILFQAALAGYLVGQAMRPLRLRRHDQWADTIRQYRLLIAVLPGLWTAGEDLST